LIEENRLQSPLAMKNAQFAIAKPPAVSHSAVIGYAGETNYASAVSQTADAPGRTGRE
jgi:hypothetical protein